ncbi:MULTISPECIES: alpha/beta fold hydrolase BchO [unclassified Sphingomonas]|uniref:alpha/beta fold hydrolase BchO n=1 Tax=unclassified Sphingomonas TaxID=196159 RepID=UPI000BD36E54|nr:MAG: alpha/beta hydrolase [Sphingomonas sp. 12-62-6]OYX40246.1 MAG: alpha/beta hydrolase [Sphingomonas sp. 32-62-10]
MLTDRARWDVEGRDWPNRAQSRFVTTDRVKWHVQVMGSGPVILLIHGTGAATHSWRELMPLLAAHFTVVAPDMPGHGFTVGRPLGGLSMGAMARAAGALLAELQLEPALIIGHSAGAAIAARMVLDGLVAPTGVIGLNAALQPFPGLAAKMFPTLARMLFVNPFAPHIFAGIARQRGEAGRFLARSTGSKIDAAGADFYGRLFATPAHCAGAITMMADWDLESLARDLPRLSVPLLLVHGDDDAAIPLASAQAAVAQVTGAQIISLPGLGHLAHEEQPGAIADRIIGFARAIGVMAA